MSFVPRQEAVLRVADILGGADSRPPWLIHALSRMANEVSAFREVEESIPPRTTIKAELSRVRDAVTTLREGLSDPVLLAFIGDDWAPDRTSERAVFNALESLSLHAQRALLRVAQTPKVPIAFPNAPNERIGAMQLCAWTVRQAIWLMTGTAPGVNNPTAHIAANALWRAAGGIPLGSESAEKAPSGWRTYFEDARDADLAGDERSAWLATTKLTFRALPPPTDLG